jgi:hypothetical protein
LLYPYRVARVSRFDRQLRYYSEPSKLASVLSMYGRAELQNKGNPCKAQKRCSDWSSVSVLHCHWPPESCGRRLSAAPSAGCPAGLPFLGFARLAVALAGACCSWLTDLRQPVHHWQPCSSNQWAVLVFLYYQPFTRILRSDFL